MVMHKCQKGKVRIKSKEANRVTSSETESKGRIPLMINRCMRRVTQASVQF